MGESKEVEGALNFKKPLYILGEDPIETHELTEAEVHEIHKHGSPHQHLDPNPHEDYFKRQAEQSLKGAKETRDSLRGQVAETLKKALPKQTIPRYLRRAVWSKNPVKIHKAIKRAEREGWTRKEMVRQVKAINEHNVATKKYKIADSKVIHANVGGASAQIK